MRKEFALAREAADAWTDTAGQTAACVSSAALMCLVRANVQGTARVLVTGDASEVALVHAIWGFPARVATSVSRARRVENAKRPVHGM